MKKIISAITIALFAGALASCTHQAEDYFDTPSMTRVNEHMRECQSLLLSAENGWAVEYYPDEERIYGGTVFAMKFDSNGNVTVAAEIAEDVTKTITSHYSLNSSSSVVLTFDTYNDYIHYWSDPDSASGNPYGGEFEFAYVSGDESEMVFRGTKTDNKVVFRALDEDIVTYVQNMLKVESAIVGEMYYAFAWNAGGAAAFDESGDDEPKGALFYDDDTANVFKFYPTGDLDGEYFEVPYVFTTEGLTFYEPVTVEGITAQTFKWENNTLIATDAVTESGNPTSVVLTGLKSPSALTYDELLGDYTLRATFYNGLMNISSMTVTLQLNSSGMGTFKEKQALEIAGSMLPIAPLSVSYSKMDGTMTLTTQYIGMSGNYYVYLCPWSTTEGYLTWGAGFGMVIRNTGTDGNIVFTFEDLGGWTYPIDGFLYYAFSGPASGSTTVGSLYRLYNFTSMTKK